MDRPSNLSSLSLSSLFSLLSSSDQFPLQRRPPLGQCLARRAAVKRSVGQIVGVAHEGVEGPHRPAFLERQKHESGVETRSRPAAHPPAVAVTGVDGFAIGVHEQ